MGSALKTIEFNSDNIAAMTEANIHLAILTAAGMWHVACGILNTRSKQLNWRPIILLSFVCAHIEIE